MESLPGAMRARNDEIEIAVEATGLNFRDLMWSLRLLPDDILEDGCTGPTLGLECAGKVVRVGADVERFEVGDPVVAMTGNAFSTHLTIPEARAEKLPPGMSFEAAATIPVAFLTAYYSLVTLANLKAGEWVLVHGGAGGVGLAAIQIAKSLGAKIIATAGSSAKRELLKRLGADHVLESRSTGFVEGVRKRALTGANGTGADVVLNSLAQDAMEQSLACLAPFGRFVELGKRDFVADTQIGVRVFRKNASYFGVDVDQLMARGDLGSQLLKRIMKEFRKGIVRSRCCCIRCSMPRAWRQAFGLMQQSAHVGKIIVQPPPAAKAIPLARRKPFRSTGQGRILSPALSAAWAWKPPNGWSNAAPAIWFCSAAAVRWGRRLWRRLRISPSAASKCCAKNVMSPTPRNWDRCLPRRRRNCRRSPASFIPPWCWMTA